MDTIKPGQVGEQTITVTPDLTAKHLGSGSIAVYATPAMIALMEYAAVAALDPLLAEGQSSVGVEIAVKHLAATPLGHQVKARAEVTGVDGRRVSFRVQAWDEQELIGEGTHTRVLIDVMRFMGRVEGKRKK